MGGSSIKGQRLQERSKLFDHRPLKLNEDDYERVCQIPKKKVKCDLPSFFNLLSNGLISHIDYFFGVKSGCQLQKSTWSKSPGRQNRGVGSKRRKGLSGFWKTTGNNIIFLITTNR